MTQIDIATLRMANYFLHHDFALITKSNVYKLEYTLVYISFINQYYSFKKNVGWQIDCMN
jgi:uncharacterized protein YhbP (UPF0306 family)